MEEKVKDYLLNDTISLMMVVREMNSWDGSFEHLDYWENEEDFFETFFSERPMEVARAISYGNYNYTDYYVKFNAYGNLESASEFEVEEEHKAEIDEIVERLIELKDSIGWMTDELMEILESEEN